MKNASRLLYIVSAIFTVGFLYETVRTVLSYDVTMSAPLYLYILSYCVFYLLPAMGTFIVGRLLAKRSGGDDAIHKVQYKKLKKRNYR